jgi:tagaturonate reductase
VPGKLSADKHKAIENNLGFNDELLIMSEVYRLWAIESSEQKVYDLLSFNKADDGVIIAPDIHIFRELKLRLLNGAHTHSCGLAHLAGFTLVRDAMNDNGFVKYITGLMQKEIIPAVTDKNILEQMANDFAAKVLDRFRNPYIDHAWLNITLQYSSKMKMRNVPALLNYYNVSSDVPQYMALGFAAHILFMRSQKNKDGKYTGVFNDKDYAVNDDRAKLYSTCWETFSVENTVHEILKDESLWGNDLSILPGFEDAVLKNLQVLMQQGAAKAIEKIIQ